jgi:glycosyltransferase involved in cell wall biosynthesis
VRVLILHNAYRQFGGEDAAVARERALLAAAGHDVHFYGVSNVGVRQPWEHLAAAVQASYAVGARVRVGREVARFRPDVVHVHNFFPLLSPAVYDACRARRVPVVQTLHNYRIQCLNGVLFRDGRACSDCVGRAVPWPGVLHGCYRGSALASGPVAAMLVLHGVLRTWSRKVDVFIVPSEFARERLVAGGLPAAKIAVKPNFVEPDPGVGRHAGGYAIYVGRLSEEKGVGTLLSAWQELGGRIPLTIVGEGPMGSAVARAASQTPGITWEGPQPPERTLRLMQDARVLIFPSLLSEVLPTVVAEAFATGLPVIVAAGGSAASMVSDGRTGLHAAAGDPRDLAAKVRRLWDRFREARAMGRAARGEFERSYTAARSREALMEIYALAAERNIARQTGRRVGPGGLLSRVSGSMFRMPDTRPW